jgi:hypothetical protein
MFLVVMIFRIAVAIPIVVRVALMFTIAVAVRIECRQWPSSMAAQILVLETRFRKYSAAILAGHILRKNYVAAAPVFHHADRNVPILLRGCERKPTPYHRTRHHDSLSHASQSPA